MIVAKLMGGLGNQMFQYAAGRALSLKLNTSFLLDLSFLRADAAGHYTQRHYDLGQFRIKAAIAGKGDLAKFQKQRTGLLGEIFKKATPYKICNESGSSYNSSFTNLNDNTLINGFWQSEKYFKSIRKQLLEEFTPAFQFSGSDEEIISELKASNSVSIHVRRGDYISLKSAAEYHGVCGIEYYNAAVKKINESVDNAKFYVFSDDLDWCRANLQHLRNVKFVKSETQYSACDLLLMSYCRHNIIANSSYSWWGAWLNQYENRIVIAPSRWFASHVAVNHDLIPSNWIKV